MTETFLAAGSDHTSDMEGVQTQFDAAVRSTCAKADLSVSSQIKRAFISLTVIPLSLVFLCSLIAVLMAGDQVTDLSSEKMTEMTVDGLRDLAVMSSEVSNSPPPASSCHHYSPVRVR